MNNVALYRNIFLVELVQKSTVLVGMGEMMELIYSISTMVLLWPISVQEFEVVLLLASDKFTVKKNNSNKGSNKQIPSVILWCLQKYIMTKGI